MDITYPKGLIKICLRKFFFAKLLVRQLPAFHPPYLPGTWFTFPVPPRYKLFSKTFLLKTSTQY